MHPGKSAQIVIAGQHAGWAGVLHPRLSDALDIQHDILLFELNLHSLMGTSAPRYCTISKYPQIRRDLSFLVDDAIPVMQIECAARSAIKEEWLKAFDIFDVYTGGGLADDHKKSVALGLLLQSNERTLVDDEIHAMITSVVTALQQKLNAVLRTSPDMA